MSLKTAEKAFAEATDPTGSKLHAAILAGVDKNGTHSALSDSDYNARVTHMS